ncbi:hypothetical protein [Providencia sp. PROV197]|uniref:hypothetical protein n=1 Tax=Providencia sp. PROV197 TaxID=2949898 RepID=UPI00234B0E91|nr:hypothetical protein [Providencia sp. PROV197]
MTQPDLRRENRTARRPLSLTTLSGLSGQLPQGACTPALCAKRQRKKAQGLVLSD